jgi:hypothetical protein
MTADRSILGIASPAAETVVFLIGIAFCDLKDYIINVVFNEDKVNIKNVRLHQK